MAPPASHSALDELLSDTPLLSDAQSLFTQAAEKAAPEGTPHVPGPPNRPAAVWLPAPHTTSVGDRALDQRHGWTRAQHDQAWPFIGAAATSNAAGTGCCTADVVSILVDVPGDRGHLKATVGTVAEDRGHLRAAAVAAQSAAHSKKARAAWRPCYQSIMKDKIAENEARAADMQAHMDALQLSTAALQSRNDELEQQLGAFGDGVEDGGPRYDEQTRAIVEHGLHLGDRTVLSCTVREDRPLYITRAELATMRQAEFRRLWHLYKDAYTVCLAACGNHYDPALPSVQRLIRLMEELDAMHGALVLTQPDRMLHFLHGLDEDAPITELTAACEAAEQKLNSISIAGQLQMTDRQLEDSQQLRTEYLARREAVMQTLGASVRQACAVSTHGMASDPQFSHSHLAGAAALAQLQRSLRERYSLEVQVETLFWNSILNPVQSALMSMETYPNHPRVPLILDALSSQQQSCSGSTSAAEAILNGSQHVDEYQPLAYGVAVQPLVAAMPG